MKTIKFTNKGKRPTNQDLIFEYKSIDCSHLYSVIDGMGGYEKGDLAAKIICESIITYLSTIDSIDPYHIQKSINKSSLLIRQTKSAFFINMGATIGGIVIKESSIIYFWLGDVKILHFRNKRLIFESSPHTLVKQILENGNLINGNQINKYKHVVTRSINGDQLFDIETSDNVFKKDSDILIVCTDGVHELFESIQLENLLVKSNSIIDFFKEIEFKVKNYAMDNASLILIYD